MTQLVFIENGRAVTDSLIVAEEFHKEHRNVLADIENQIKKLAEAGLEEWGVLNFQQTQYQHPQNKQWYPKFDMTEDAFAIVAMSYTTPEAMKMKVKFLTEFKRMKEMLLNPPVPVLTERQAIIQSLKLTAEVAEEVEVVKATTAEHGTKLVEIEQKLDKQITLNSGQQRTLQRAISKKVYAIEPDKDARGELFQQLHREIKDRWQVTSYKDVLRKELENVLNYITYWRPIKKGE